MCFTTGAGCAIWNDVRDLEAAFFLFVFAALPFELVLDKPPSLSVSLSASIPRSDPGVCGACVDPAETGLDELKRAIDVAANLTGDGGGTTEVGAGVVGFLWCAAV